MTAELFKSPPVVRTGVKRIHRRALREADVAKAVGPIAQGCEMFGLSNGAWSLVDLIAHCLRATGPAEVVICSWSAGAADIQLIAGMVAAGQITRLGYICDHSFPHRQPAYCAAARAAWGDGAFIVSDMHGKFVTIHNEGWSLCVTGTMNLNRNIRIETWQVSDSPEMFGVLNDFTQHARRVGLPLDAPQKSHRARFAREFGQGDFYDAAPLGRDMARAGVTRGR